MDSEMIERQRAYIKTVADREGTTLQCAFRDVLTDLRHIADELDLDFHSACDGSYVVYLEEKNNG